MVANERRDSTLSVYTSDSQPFQVNSPLCRSLIYHSPPPTREQWQMKASRPVASHPGGGGGGSELGWVEHQARIQDFLKGGVKTFTSTTPLGHCPRDVINLKNAPTLGHAQAPPPPLGHCPVTSPTFQGRGGGVIGRSRFA